MTKVKNLDKQITSATVNSVFVSFKGELTKPADGADQASRKFQSIKDMIRYRSALKSAIIASNAVTPVTIGGQTRTVAEAIEERKSIQQRRYLLAQLKHQHSEAVSSVDQQNTRARQQLESPGSATAVGYNDWDSAPVRRQRGTRSPQVSDTGTGRLNDEYMKMHMKMHGVELYDPINIKKQIEELESYINTFDEDIDVALSESNATTLLTVPQ